MRGINGSAGAVHSTILAKIHGMIRVCLAFTKVCEASLVNRRCANRPRMADVPLLESCGEVRSKSRNVGTRSLKERKWLSIGRIIDVVIDAELLIGRDLVF